MQIKSSYQRIIPTCLVILLVLCICLSITSIITAGMIYINNSASTTPGINISKTELSSENLSVDQQIDEIENNVSTLRGLKLNSSVNRNFLTSADLRQHVLDNFFKDYSDQDAQNDALMLWAFGLLEKDFNLLDFYVDLYSEQIAGYYDQETKEMYVVQDAAFGGPERLTYAHEFTHALQDQTYDIENGLKFNDESCKNETERCSAISALLEGDASLTEAFWLSNYGTPQDQKEISEFYSNYSSPVYDNAPTFIKEDFIFPYQAGQKFVERLYNAGGWDYVNQAYENPPISSEQILHPEKYPDDIPFDVSIPDLGSILGPNWEEVDHGMMGEWYTYLVLEAGYEEVGRLTQAEASKASTGWQGDSYVVYNNSEDDSVVLILFSQWESSKEAREFQDAFINYADKRFGNPKQQGDNFTFWESQPGIQSLKWVDEYTAWVIAPDQVTTSIIWEILNLP